MRFKVGRIGEAEALTELMRVGKLDEAQARALLRTADMIKVDWKLLEKYGYE